MNTLFSKIRFILFRPFYAFMHICIFLTRKTQFREYHWSNRVASMKMIKPKYISLGECVCIGHNARIEGVDHWNDAKFEPLIAIGHHTTIQQDVHITCAKNVHIGSFTAIAARVTITDINHPYENITTPIDKQDIVVNAVSIGDQCKIYNGAVILPGVQIGRHCVIGANSVVNTNIPDYSVAVGIPAKIIKRYDFNRKEWRKTNKEGQFIE